MLQVRSGRFEMLEGKEFVESSFEISARHPFYVDETLHNAITNSHAWHAYQRQGIHQQFYSEHFFFEPNICVWKEKEEYKVSQKVVVRKKSFFHKEISELREEVKSRSIEVVNLNRVTKGLVKHLEQMAKCDGIQLMRTIIRCDYKDLEFNDLYKVVLRNRNYLDLDGKCIKIKYRVEY